jgi:UPF0271 protein
MRETVRAARDRGVAIGAHPSYPDLPGFGRRELGLAASEIKRHVATQIGALSDVCGAERARLTHVKPHGALYNRAARDSKAARAVAEAIRETDRELVLLGLAASEMMRAAARAGIRFVSEAFVDRAYTSELLLVPRDQPGALIEDVGAAVARGITLVERRTVSTIDGVDLPLDAVSLCVHGDNPDALRILRDLRSALEEAGVSISPFAS